MKFFRKQTNWSTLALLSIVPFVPGVSYAMAPELTSVMPYVDQANAAAQGAMSKCAGAPPSAMAQCTSCANHLTGTAVAGLPKIKEIVGKYTAATVAGTTSVAQTGKTSAATGSQLGQTVGAEGATDTGSQSNAAREALAKEAQSIFADCDKKAVDSVCNGALNQDDAQKVSDACSSGSRDSGAVAQANGKAGSTLGEMAGALGQAAQALGPLMQQMMQGQGAGAGSSNPYGSTVSKPAPLASAKLSASNPAAGGSVGFGSGASTGVDGTNAASGYAPAYQARSFEAEPTLASSLGGSDPGSTGGASSGGVSTTGASSMGGAGSFGSKDSSGASKMGEKNAGIMDPNNFEMPSGGSSGGRPFLGLKSKSASLEDSASGADTSSSFASELGLDEEGRDLASTDQLGSDIHGEESGTLFDAIRSKYSEIKKRGNI